MEGSGLEKLQIAISLTLRTVLQRQMAWQAYRKSLDMQTHKVSVDTGRDGAHSPLYQGVAWLDNKREMMKLWSVHAKCWADEQWGLLAAIVTSCVWKTIYSQQKTLSLRFSLLYFVLDSEKSVVTSAPNTREADDPLSGRRNYKTWSSVVWQ
jgi:hypothetical protein